MDSWRGIRRLRNELAFVSTKHHADQAPGLCSWPHGPTVNCQARPVQASAPYTPEGGAAASPLHYLLISPIVLTGRSGIFWLLLQPLVVLGCPDKIERLCCALPDCVLQTLQATSDPVGEHEAE